MSGMTKLKDQSADFARRWSQKHCKLQTGFHNLRKVRDCCTLHDKWTHASQDMMGARQRWDISDFPGESCESAWQIPAAALHYSSQCCRVGHRDCDTCCSDLSCKVLRSPRRDVSSLLLWNNLNSSSSTRERSWRQKKDTGMRNSLQLEAESWIHANRCSQTNNQSQTKPGRVNANTTVKYVTVSMCYDQRQSTLAIPTETMPKARID